MHRLPTGRQSKDLQGILGILFKRLMNEIRVRPLSLPRRTPPPVLLPRMAACVGTQWAIFLQVRCAWLALVSKSPNHYST